MISGKDEYFVAVKVFLEDNDGNLFVFKDKWGDWDLPGGRIKPHEFETPLEDIVERKLREELGDAFSYTLMKPEIFMRHERVEDAPGNPTVRIFALGYRAQMTDGAITLSEHHTEHKWIDVSQYDPTADFNGGWLKGVQEYLTLRNNS